MAESEEHKKKRNSYTIWTEKYRPCSISNVVLTKDFKKYFGKMVQDKEIPNLIFYSTSPGTAKTTIAKALALDIDADYVYINTSLENGIDVVRSRIEKFALSYSEKGKKIVILDEFDGSSRQLQDALRATTEAVQNSCRFIFTCNSITKIIEPLQSRCQLVNFNLNDKNIRNELQPLILKRIIGIIKNEKIKDSPIVFDETIVAKLVESMYPDMRKMLNLLQQYSAINGIIDEGVFTYNSIDLELYELIVNKKLTAARKFIMDNSYNYDDLYRGLFINLIPMIDKAKQAESIIIIAEYLYRNATIIDKEINFTACMLEIMSTL